MEEMHLSALIASNHPLEFGVCSACDDLLVTLKGCEQGSIAKRHDFQHTVTGKQQHAISRGGQLFDVTRVGVEHGNVSMCVEFPYSDYLVGRRSHEQPEVKIHQHPTDACVVPTLKLDRL